MIVWFICTAIIITISECAVMTVITCRLRFDLRHAFDFKGMLHGQTSRYLLQQWLQYKAETCRGIETCEVIARLSFSRVHNRYFDSSRTIPLTVERRDPYLVQVSTWHLQRWTPDVICEMQRTYLSNMSDAQLHAEVCLHARRASNVRGGRLKATLRLTLSAPC